MKKFAIVIIILFLSFIGKGQLFKIGNHEIGFLYVGPTAGIASTWVSNITPTSSTTAMNLGYNFGIVGKFGLTKKLSIEPELKFLHKGHRETFSGGDSKTIANYIGIPILAKFSFIKISNLTLHGSGGIYNNITLSSKFVMNSGSYNEEQTIESTHYKTVDFGFSFGGGFEYELSTGLLAVDLIVEQGVTDIYKDNYNTTSNRNTTVGVNVTYLYDFVDLMANVFKKKIAKQQ